MLPLSKVFGYTQAAFGYTPKGTNSISKSSPSTQPLHICETEYHRNIAVELNNVASNLYHHGEFSNAMDFYREAVNALMTISNDDHRTLQSFSIEHKKRLAHKIVDAKERLSHLNSFEHDSELSRIQFVGGAVCSMKAIKLQCPTSDDNAVVLHNMALIHSKLGSFGLAERLFANAASLIKRRSYVLQLKVYLSSSNNLGWIFQRQMKVDEAMRVYVLCLSQLNLDDVCEQESRAIVASMLYNMGMLEVMKGSHDKAIDVLNNACILFKDSIGDNHPDIASILYNIGKVQVELGMLTTASSSFLESLQIRRYVFGNDHHSVTGPLTQLGKLHMFLGEYSPALNVFEEKVRVEAASLGDSHLDLASTYSNIGEIHYIEGDAIGAIIAYKKALKIIKKSNEPNNNANISTASMLVTMGKIYQEIGNSKFSAKYFSDARSILCQLQQFMSPDVELLSGLIDFHLAHPAAAAAA